MSFGNAGGGVRLEIANGGGPPDVVDPNAKKDEEKQDQEKQVAVFAQILNSKQKYANAPVVPDQLEKYPASVIPGPPIMLVFDVMDETERQKLNELMAESEPKGSPKVELIEHKDYWSPDQCKLITKVWHRRLMYAQFDAAAIKILSDNASKTG